MSLTTGRVLWRFGGMAVAALIQFGTYVVLARFLGVDGYGAFAAVFGGGMFAVTLSGAGFTHRALRLRAEPAHAPEKRATMVAYRISAAAVIAALALVVASLTGSSAASGIIAAIFIAIDAVNDICQSALAGAGRLGRATVVLICQRALLLGAVIMLATTDSALWILAAALVMIATNAALTIRRMPSLALLRDLMRTSGSYWRANLASSISQLEVPLITMFGGTMPSGLYAAGARAGGPVNLLAQALLHAATPELSGAPALQRAVLFRRMRLITWAIVAIALLVAVPAGLLGAWIFGDEYTRAWPIVAGFVVGGALMGVNQAHQALLFAIGQAAPAARAIGVGALVALGFAVACALWLPIWCLAFTPVVAQGVMQAGLARAVRRSGEAVRKPD